MSEGLKKVDLKRVLLSISVVLVIVVGGLYGMAYRMPNSAAFQFMTTWKAEKTDLNSEKHLEYQFAYQADISGEEPQRADQAKSVLVVNTTDEAKQFRFNSPYVKARGKQFNSLHSEIFQRRGSTRTLLCADTGEEAQEVELFFTQFNAVVFGGVYSRSAWVCGDEYVISDYDSAEGVSEYGPFNLK